MLQKHSTLHKGFAILLSVMLLSFAAWSGCSAPAVNPVNTGSADGTAPATGAGGDQTATNVPARMKNYPEITELMSSNKGSIAAADGNYYDWIELYNPTDQAINLEGFALSDNIKKPTKFVLPAWTLDPGKYVIVYASGKTSTDAELHAPFKLDSAGQTVILRDPDGNLLQAVTYPKMKSDISYAMDANDAKKWALTDKYTPGFPNTDEGYGDYEQSLRVSAPVGINEVMADNTLTIKDEDGDYSDWIELCNPTDKAVDLTGWGLSNKEGEPKRWVFPKTTLAAKSCIVVFASGKDRAVAGQELHTDFKLNAMQDTVLLSNLRGQIVSEVQISNLKPDTSYALTPGTGKWQAFTEPTPGYPNDEEGWNALQPKLYGNTSEPVVINEVMSNNASTIKDRFNEYPDWIELYNRSDKGVDLKGWGLTNKSDEPGRWKFPDITLQPGDYLTVFASGRNLADQDAVSKKELHTDFKLDADGFVIALTAPDGHVADRCFVPALRVDTAFGRTENNAGFLYIGKPTPGKANQGGYQGMEPDPRFSINAGMYGGAQNVALTADDPNAKIYYTLDGTTPTKSSKLYSKAIDMQKTTVIRAIACRDGYLPSTDVCSTYLIGEGINLPVVSIVTDPKNLFDKNTGIDENISKDWEKPAHAELLEPDGTVGFSQDIGIKLFGSQSKIDNKQKSYALMARSVYGKNSFDYAVFPDLPYTSYKDLVLRNSAMDANRSRIRDILQIGLAQESADVDAQDHRQSVLFINGEFWGVYDIVEKVNTNFLAQHNNLDPDKIDLLGANGTVIDGSNKDYNALIQYVKSHDMTKAECYNYVASKIDIDNFIDWCTIEIFTGNSDLGNVKMWKPQTPGGKWRWILYDMDWGFFFITSYPYYLDPFKRFFDPRGNGIGNNFSNTIARGLIKNAVFRQKFIERFAYQCNVTYNPDKVLKRIDELVANIAPYMARDKAKWHTGTVNSWMNVHIALLKEFIADRPAMDKQCFQSYFHLSDGEMETLFK